MTTFSYTSADHLALLPPLLLAIFACATMLLDVAARYADQAKRGVMGFGLVGLALTGYALFLQWNVARQCGSAVYHGAAKFRHDRRACRCSPMGLSWWQPRFYFSALTGISKSPTSIGRSSIAWRYSPCAACTSWRRRWIWFCSSSALETAAVSFYILVGFTRTDRRSNEAALKYLLLLGALASGFVVYGFSLLYGISGSTRLTEIAVCGPAARAA